VSIINRALHVAQN